MLNLSSFLTIAALSASAFARPQAPARPPPGQDLGIEISFWASKDCGGKATTKAELYQDVNLGLPPNIYALSFEINRDMKPGETFDFSAGPASDPCAHNFDKQIDLAKLHDKGGHHVCHPINNGAASCVHAY